MNVKEIKEQIAVGNMDAVETAWMEAIEAGEDLAHMRAVLAALVEASQAETAETLGGLLLSEAVDKRTPEEALDVARAVLPALPGRPELRQTAAKLYRKVCGQADNFEDLLNASGLLGGQTPRRAVLTLDTCLPIKPGDYLANRFDHRVVKVSGFSPALGQYELKAADGEMIEMDPKLLGDEFERVDEGDYRVLCQYRRSELPALLERDPAGVLIGICMSHGGRIDTTALKDMLAGKVLDSSKWTGWWNRARTAIKRSEFLTLEGRNPGTIIYHPAGKTVEEQFAGSLAEARTPLDCHNLLQAYAREIAHRKQPPKAEFVGPILQTLAEQASSLQARRPAEALTAALAVEAAIGDGLPAPQAAHPSSADVLAASPKPLEMVLEQPSGLWPAAYEALSKRPDAPEQFLKLLRLAPAGQLDTIVARLRGAGREAAVLKAVADAVAKPAQNLQICLWLWDGPAEPVQGMPSKLALLSTLLGAVQEIDGNMDVERTVRRDAFQEIRAGLTAGGCRSYKQAVAEMDRDVAQTFKRRVERCAALSDVAREALIAALKEKFYDLFVVEKAPPWADPNVLWSTEQAVRNLEEKRKHLMEIEMPANSRAIGEAAAKGDLSENSEWQYAVEEQRRLQAKAQKMQDDLARIRVLHAHDVPHDHVGVGSRVTMKRLADGVIVELSFLGPYEADVEKRVFNYQTPVAQTLMGKTVGDTVKVALEGRDDEYVITRLGSAL